MHLDAVGSQIRRLGPWEVLPVAEAAEVILQGHLQHCLSSACLEWGTGMLKTLMEVYRGSLSLQGVFKFRGQAEKVPHAVLVHWSGGAPTIVLFSSWL